VTTIVEELRALKRKGLSQNLSRGTVPNVQLTNDPLTWRGWWIFLGTALLVFIGDTIALLWLKNLDFFAAIDRAAGIGIISGLAVALLYYLLPILRVLGFTLWHKQRPPRHIFNQFSGGQKFVCLALIAFGLVYLFNHVYPAIEYYLRTHRLPRHWFSHHSYVTAWWPIAVIVLALTIVLGFLVPLLFPRELRPRKTRFKGARSDDLGSSAISPFALWVGRSTGRLASLWHQAGIAANLDIALTTEDAAQNILVLGGIGAGKTTRLMQPLLVQLLDQECGGLLFDVKGDVKKAVIQLGEITNRPVTIIGPNHNQMNLLAGLTPEIAASFLKSAFLLNGGVRLDGFWIDTATELCRNTLGLLSFLPTHYTLQGLYSYLFDDEARETIQAELNPLLITLEAKEQRLLKTYLRYHETIFATFDEKVKSGVNATVAQALSPFNHPELIDAFCEQSQTSLNMQSVLDGTVYLVDMPLARWGLGGKVAYTFIKLRFFNVMQNRVHQPDWNQDRPIFFMCDEYQELISASKDGLSDLNFWDKSRSSKTMGIISAQSVSSFYAALGDRDLAHAILQNFRQKICFRTEDQATLTMMDRLAGQAKVQRKTTSQTTGDSTRAFTEPTSKHHSSTQSITESRESVLDATLFRNLTPNQAVALLSLYGHSMDDVLECLPVFF
jgi:hypothetical protein